jgi:plastocyanin
MNPPNRRALIAVGVVAVAIVALGMAVASPGFSTSMRSSAHGAAMDTITMHGGGVHTPGKMNGSMNASDMHGGAHPFGMMSGGMHMDHGNYADVTACQDCTQPGSDPNATQVTLRDSAFDPQTLTIKVGQSVEWVNADEYGHTVTSDDGRFESGLIPSGQAWTYEFVEPGTYTYHCEPHSARQSEGPYMGMVGTIVVEA